MKLPPGWKTSEFWLTLIATALGVLTSLGLVSPAGPVAVVVGGVLTVAPTLLYTQQRTSLKIATVNPNGSLVDPEDPPPTLFPKGP